MSISMDNFASAGHFANFDPYLHTAPPVAAAMFYRVQVQ